ncbi:hypothetical protein PCASD_09418 [Puccinia coronata f. sp. avenae]|uniref:Uncharacterized protein n=1 Tax=Puccinia coronata f. sp. avenae TaxID=200324 RepID=A0A2N5UHN4_9BASI|nr:hypothetical protein PCASD_09418 [Puccinia coronata f. sp. avenae]
MAEPNYPFGKIPPLPFPNANKGSQETWLGPSQTLNSNQGSFRLFFEPTQPTTKTGTIPSSTTNNTADGNGHGVVGNNPPNTPLVSRRPVPPEVICETPKAIHIDYVVFNWAVATPAPSRSQSTLAAKDWDKLTPTSDIVWKTPIIKWSWCQFQAEVINTLTKDWYHIGNHIITLDKANLLKWKCILVQHCVYGVNSDCTVTSNTKFHPFLEVIRMSPTSKIVIKLVMEDPVVQAKKIEAPKADLDANARVKKIQEITAHIIGKYGCNAESLHIRDPEDCNQSIQIDGTCLTIWSCALMHGANGVDLNRPSQGKEFVSEPKRAWTVA